MRSAADSAGAQFTYDPATGEVIPLVGGVVVDPKTGQAIKAPTIYSDGPGGSSPSSPSTSSLQAQIDASKAANPQAAGANGTLFTYGGQGGTAPDQTTTAPVDWSSMLGVYGLPPDVAAKVNQIFTNTSDVNQATALAMAYVRGTDWYAKTYPGIQEGIARGVVSNEADYRSYVNQLQQLNKQYYNTDITSQQIADYLKAGYSVGHVNQLFAGHAYAVANKDDLNFLLGHFGENGVPSDQDLEALGQENAGLDSVLGQKIQSAVQKATQRMSTVFGGTLATPSLTLGGNGLQATSLSGSKAAPDVAS